MGTVTWIASCMCGWQEPHPDRLAAEQAARGHAERQVGRHKPTVRERIDE